MFDSSITPDRFCLPAASVDALSASLSSAYQRPAPSFSHSGVDFGAQVSGEGYTERNKRGSFASLADLLTASKLDWRPSLDTVHGSDGAFVAGVRLVRRSDTGAHLGIVSDSYGAVSAVDAFGALLGPAIACGAVTADRAGLIGGRAFVQASMSLAPLEVIPGDVVLPSLTGVHSFDGKSATRAGFTPVRVVCKNTLAMAYRDAGNQGFTVSKHGPNALARMKGAGERLNSIAQQFQVLGESWRFMAARPFSQKELRDLLARIFEINAGSDKGKLDKLEATIRDLQERGKGSAIPGVRGSAWGTFNAITEYGEHHSSVRGSLSEGDRRWERVLDGSVASLVERAQVEVLRAVGTTETQARATLRGSWS
jgi:phage/plasmid-like protein (TIGR03299 family)